MAHNADFDCASVRRLIRSFLDDLLTEEEYLAFTAHLGQCEACRAYTASIGSLSNQLRELGTLVKVPADLVPTVLFRLNSRPRASRPVSFKAIIVIAGVAALVVGVFAAIHSKGSGEKKTAHSAAVPVTAGGGEEFFREVKPEQPAPAAQETSGAPGTSGSAGTRFSAASGSAGVSPLAQAPAQIQSLRALHWHVTVGDKQEEEKLIKTIKAMDIPVEYLTPDLIVFSLLPDDVRRLRQGVAMNFALRDFSPAASGDDKRARKLFLTLERVPAPPTSSTGAVEVVNARPALVSLEKEAGSSLHWHIMFVSPKKDELFDLMRAAGGLKEFESEEMVVFSVPAGEVKKLSEQVHSLAGVFADFDLKAAGETFADERVKISLYFMER